MRLIGTLLLALACLGCSKDRDAAADHYWTRREYRPRQKEVDISDRNSRRTKPRADGRPGGGNYPNAAPIPEWSSGR